MTSAAPRVVHVALAALAASQPAAAATPAGDLFALGNAHYERNYRAVLEEFAGLVAIPNHAGNPQDIDRNVAALEAMLVRRGLRTRRLEAPGASPALFAEFEHDPVLPIVLFYAHYDGQPAGSTGWNSPPFIPTLERDGRRMPLQDALGGMTAVPSDAWRIYGRSSADDKAAILAMLAALDALAAAQAPRAVNLKVFLEGEEEVGSPHLAKIVTANAFLLASDLMLFADGPRHQSGRPQVALGVRGVQSAEITLFGPMRALHSGHYGNWAVNPAARLAELLTTLRTRDGRVRIAGFYDDVDQKLADRGVVADDALERVLLKDLRLGRRESVDQPLARSVAWPSLNIVGIKAADTGAAARNAIPSEATANLDFRLVPRQTPHGVRRLLTAHLRSLGYQVVATREEVEAAASRDHVVLVQWDRSGYPGVRFTENAAGVRELIGLLREVHGEKLFVAPILGGSLPLALFAQNAPVSAVVVLPIANYDNNQHAPDENLTLGSLRYGIATFTAIFGALSIDAVRR